MKVFNSRAPQVFVASAKGMPQGAESQLDAVIQARKDN